MRQMPKKDKAKLQVRYKGPYRVTKMISDVVLQLRDLKTSKIHTAHRQSEGTP